jgi:cytochrome c-type biogenesis protein CcmH/NrfG
MANTFKTVLILFVACLGAFSVSAGEDDKALQDAAAALQKALGRPVKLEIHQNAQQRVLVARLLPQAETPAPWEQQDLFVPLFRTGCAANRRALDVERVQVRSSDPLSQAVTAETSLAAVRQFYDKQISPEDFKKAVSYRVQRKDFTADELHRQALATGDNEQETALLRQAVAKDPQHLPARALLAFKLFNTGDPDTLPHLLETRKLAPKALEVRWFLASTYRNAKAWDQMLAESVATEALAEADGVSIVPSLNLPEERAKQLSEAWNKNVILRELSQFRCAYFIDAKKPDAQAAVEAHVKAWPDDATGHLLLGIHHMTREDAAKAQRSLEKSAALNPSNITLWRMLGVVYAARKKYREEALAMRRALVLGDEQADNYVKLGFAYAQLEEWYDCKHVSGEGLKLFPIEEALRRNFKEAHKVILLRSLKQPHPVYPLSSPLDIQEMDLAKP